MPNEMTVLQLANLFTSAPGWVVDNSPRMVARELRVEF